MFLKFNVTLCICHINGNN